MQGSLNEERAKMTELLGAGFYTTHSVTSIQMQLRNIAGGPTWARLVNEIRDGELTISSPLNVLTTKIQEAKNSPNKSLALITAQ